MDPNCAMVSSPVTPRSCHHGSILVPFHGVESVSATPRTAEAKGTAPAKKKKGKTKGGKKLTGYQRKQKQKARAEAEQRD